MAVDGIFGDGYLNDIDIGGNAGLTKDAVDEDIKHIVYDNSNKCICCGNKATFKMIPLREELNTAQVEDHGYVCDSCYRHYLPTDFKFKDLRR